MEWLQKLNSLRALVRRVKYVHSIMCFVHSSSSAHMKMMMMFLSFLCRWIFFMYSLVSACRQKWVPDTHSHFIVQQKKKIDARNENEIGEMRVVRWRQRKCRMQCIISTEWRFHNRLSTYPNTAQRQKDQSEIDVSKRAKTSSSIWIFTDLLLFSLSIHSFGEELNSDCSDKWQHTDES